MKLCVVTDIHDQPDPERCFATGLVPPCNITRFALNNLCKRPELTGEALHQHLFAHGGMEHALAALTDRLTGKQFIGLGYSAGGTAIWRLAATNPFFAMIFCVSSTRLRDEGRITTPHQVFFGADDLGRPSDAWCATVPHKVHILAGAQHDYYTQNTSEATAQSRKLIAAHL